MAAEVQPPDWLWSQVLLLPHVPRRGLHGVETVLRSGPFEQVRWQLIGKVLLMSPLHCDRPDAAEHVWNAASNGAGLWCRQLLPSVSNCIWL